MVRSGQLDLRYTVPKVPACPEMLSLEKVPKVAQLCDRVKTTRINSSLIFHLRPSRRITLCTVKNERPLQTLV